MGTVRIKRGRRPSPGQNAIDWIQDLCRIPEGKNVGQLVRLLPFQQKIIKDIYNKPTRRAIITFGRKNGKNSLWQRSCCCCIWRAASTTEFAAVQRGAEPGSGRRCCFRWRPRSCGWIRI